jgi:signal transduction histidine kinase
MADAGETVGMSSGKPAASPPGRRPRVVASVPRLPSAGAAPDTPRAGPVEPALTWLRWTIIATMLLIVLAWPVPGRLGHPLWPLVAAFAGYNLLVELARRHVPRLRSFAWVPFLDLPVAGVLYFLDAEPGGPLFVAFYLAVVTAATCLSLRAAALYTAAVIALIVAIAPTLPRWSPEPGQLRELAARMVVLTMVGVGTAVLTQRLARQETVARSMREEAARLEELDRLRSEFVASASHDLRTPLTAAQAGLGFLDDSAAERLRPDERDLLANARRNVDRLGALIDDLLTANQLEAGALRLDREPFDLRLVVTDAMAAVHPLIHEKGQTLEVDLPTPLPVEGDARRLEHAVVNVLANAHRHTPTGACIAIAGRRDAGEARLTVGDDGPGIPPGDLERVFLRFYRRGPAGGSGLGLANARGIVELHGGWIRAASEPGRGATFTIALPLQEEADEPCR